MFQRILVLGGTGFVGRAVCNRLVERGQGNGRILVPTRRLAHGQRLQSLPTVELMALNVHDDAALARAVAGADAVVNLVAILHGSAADFQHVHVALPQRLARACQAQGVRRVVHVSALGVGAGAPSNYLRSKAAGEAALVTAGLDLTILRPSVIFGAEDRFLNLFADLQALAPLLPLAGRGTRFQPVWVEDVATAIVRCLDRDDTVGKTYECAGPEVCTLAELVRLAGLWSGHERPQLTLPMWAGRLQAGLMEMLPGTPPMSRDNLDSMQVPNVASGQLPGLEALGITAAALDAVAPAYLGGVSGLARLDRWRRCAGRD
ncbi:NAD-dependent dehydratase [Rubrivivax sp. A210]|uniref:complex I NDUFA9 subunit family protein n=1 Tax=Rubrivivax sp. A210 TaxID=2772301 RepID=UPI00191876FB|nr:complex I NDUFA9 subunit family protein [Rubrivivax sp. A210]CAD5374196.1 NAD-dependent dehydratase [Rubrivivax sp. A210]